MLPALWRGLLPLVPGDCYAYVKKRGTPVSGMPLFAMFVSVFTLRFYLKLLPHCQGDGFGLAAMALPPVSVAPTRATLPVVVVTSGTSPDLTMEAGTAGVDMSTTER